MCAPAFSFQNMNVTINMCALAFVFPQNERYPQCMCALCVGFLQKRDRLLFYVQVECCGKQDTSLCLWMSRETGAAGSTLNVLERDIVLRTGHERCINTPSCSPGFLPSTTTTFLLLIPKDKQAVYMWAPTPLFQNNNSPTGMCACAALFPITKTKLDPILFMEAMSFI